MYPKIVMHIERVIAAAKYNPHKPPGTMESMRVLSAWIEAGCPTPTSRPTPRAGDSGYAALKSAPDGK